MDTLTKHIAGILASTFKGWRELVFIRIILLFILFISTYQDTIGQTTTYTSSGTFTVPAGVTSVSVQCWGAGGGGAGSNVNKYGGGGGGGGAYTVNNSVSVVPGASYTITIGTGGAGGSGSNLNGGLGGNTSANLGITVTANGGSGGLAPNTSTGGAGGVAGTYSGGAGAIGQKNTSGASGGGGGSSAGTGANGNPGINTSGGTVTNGGAGGGGGASGIAGSAGSAPGGGGGGGGQNASGGKGADGKVIITYMCPTYSLSGASASSVCAGNQTTVSLTSTVANLPVGIYAVTYNLGSPNTAFGLTATMNVTTAGIGSFSIPGTSLANSGSTTITITTLSSGVNCISSVSGISANLTVNASPAITSPTAVCVGSTGNLTPSSGVTWSSSNTAVATVTDAGAITGVSAGSATFTYTYLSSGCNKTSSSVSISTVATITLTSAINTSSQTLCSGAIIPITYSASGATGALVTGLPSGVTGNYNSGVFTISGTPIVTGTFNYTVTPTGTSCSPTSASGTIYVVSSIDAGDITAVRSGGRCGVNIVGDINVTCPDGSPATYIWEYKLNGTSTWLVVQDSSRSDLFPSNIDFGRAKYRRTAVCGSCSSAPTVLNSPIASYMGVTISSTNVQCFNANDGTATATVNGGYAPFTYSWSPTTPTQTTATATGLAPGSYTVNVHDSYNCSSNTSVTITGPTSALSASITNTTNVTCYGSATGSLTITALGGWGGYTYSLNGTTWQSNNVFSNLVAGTYAATVKDANNCVVTTSSVTITQPSAPISASLTSTNVTCNGVNDGTITISSPAGGYGTYEYSINGTSWQTSGAFTGLTNATYNVQVRDAAHTSCVITLNAGLVITQPAVLSITTQPLPQTDCYGNHIEFSVSVSGVVGTVTYQWQQKPPRGTFSDVSGANSALLSIDNIGMYGQNVDGTEYRVIITDDCRTITSNSALLHVNSITGVTPATGTSTICDGGGISYAVTTSGIVTGYQWSFDNGSGYTALSNGGAYSGVTSAQLTISNATTTQSGGYRVSVTFETLNQPVGYPTCIETSSTRPRNLIVRSPLAAPVISSSQQVCYNTAPSALTATASTGGSGPYSYQWQSSPDGTSWTDINGETTLSYAPPALTTTTYYRILVTDGGVPSCGFINSEPVKITANSLPIPTLTSSDADNLICTGDVVTFTASGGTSYNFKVNGTSVQISTSATYTTTSLTNGQTVDVVVTNVAGCNATSTDITTTVSPYPDPNPIVNN